MEVDNPENSETSVNSTASDEDMFASFQESPLSANEKTVMQDQYPQSSLPKAETLSPTPKLASPSTGESWRGTPISKLTKNTGKDLFPPVVAGPQHSVLFKLPVKKGEVPKPWPEMPEDKWDQNHVRMPHSGSSLYPVTPTELRRRWEMVHHALTSTISSSHQLEAAILHYNSKYSDRWDFKALHSFFSETLEELETEYFFVRVLPKVIELALNVPNLVTGAIPLLRRHVTHSISLSQQQISCLLANALLCTFPRRNTSKKQSEYCTFPDINFNRLFSGYRAEAKGRMSSLHEKLKCLVNYFRRVTTNVPDGVVTYSRHYIPPSELPDWSKETCQFTNLYVSSSGTIEDEGYGMLQMDFANKMVGGGVLGLGCVQEEIRFVICPELILSRLFTEVLDDSEALIVSGCERFNAHQGYADNFEWTGDYVDSTPQDSYGRRCCTVVAIDACRFPNPKTQYSAENINRELNKAYTGFSWGTSSDSSVRECVATGNWGCGAFRGDACLKSLLQLMAVARAGRDLAYFTFGDTELRDKLADMYNFLVKQQVTVGDLWKVITSYDPRCYHHILYDHIYKAVTMGSIPTPLKTFMPKKPRVQEARKQKVELNNSHRLNTEEIANALENEDMEEDIEGVRPVEAKTLSVHSDRDLCLKRLSSSWTNLNESKRDFGSSECSSYEPSAESSTHNIDSSKHSVGSNGQTSGSSRKKRISDYFQPVSK